MAPLATLWRGILVGGAGPGAGVDFCHARIPLDGSHSRELRGWTPLASEIALAQRVGELLGETESRERIERIESERSSLRFARVVDSNLAAFLALSIS